MDMDCILHRCNYNQFQCMGLVGERCLHIYGLYFHMIQAGDYIYRNQCVHIYHDLRNVYVRKHLVNLSLNKMQN